MVGGLWLNPLSREGAKDEILVIEHEDEYSDFFLYAAHKSYGKCTYSLQKETDTKLTGDLVVW